MPILLKNNGGKDFDPVPAAMHQAVCYGVVDIGTQKPSIKSQYGPKRKVIFLFELPHERADFGEDKKNQPRAISLMHTNSLGERANLRRDLEGWRSRPFTEEELKGFDPKNVIGANAQLNVVHEKSGEKTYANIKSITPLAKGMTKLTQENPTLYFSLDDQPDLTNIQFPENMPQWIQAKIMFSEEVLAALERKGEPTQSAPTTQDTSAPNEDVPF